MHAQGVEDGLVRISSGHFISDKFMQHFEIKFQEQHSIPVTIGVYTMR
jgi:hypothetical protein